MQCVILAGGLATRLGKLTTGTPKSLIEVRGRPFIEYQFRQLKKADITNVLLLVGHLGEEIRKTVGDGEAFGLSVKYKDDGPRLLGTGGALRAACDLLEESFLVMYGDSYLRMDFGGLIDGLNDHTFEGVLGVYENCGRWDRSNVILGEDRVMLYDKRNPTPEMHHIDYGVMALSRAAVMRLPVDTSCDLALLLHQLSLEGKLGFVEASKRFYEIGTRSGLKEFAEYLESLGPSEEGR